MQPFTPEVFPGPLHASMVYVIAAAGLGLNGQEIEYTAGYIVTEDPTMIGAAVTDIAPRRRRFEPLILRPKMRVSFLRTTTMTMASAGLHGRLLRLPIDGGGRRRV